MRDALFSTEKTLRESQGKADAIDAAVYDLKAVNPRARSTKDTRTPTEILEAIDAHGSTVDAALAKLRKLMLTDTVE